MLKTDWDELQATIAIIGLIILEIVALNKGINGQLFSLVIIVIAGLAGYKFKEITNK